VNLIYKIKKNKKEIKEELEAKHLFELRKKKEEKKLDKLENKDILITTK